MLVNTQEHSHNGDLPHPPVTRINCTKIMRGKHFRIVPVGSTDDSTKAEEPVLALPSVCMSILDIELPEAGLS